MRGESLVITRSDIDVVLTACIPQHPDSAVITAALREIAGLVPIPAAAVIKDRDTARLNTTKSNGESLRKAIKDSRFPVTGGPLTLRVIGVVSICIQQPAGSSGQPDGLGKQARVVSIIAFVIHMKRDAPRSRALRILRSSIDIVCRLLLE